MRLWLTHGRDDPEQEMDGWGYNGPELNGVESVQQMYGETTTVRFVSAAARDEALSITGWEIWDDTTLEVRDGNGLIETRQRGQPRQFFGSVLLYHEPTAPTIRGGLSYARDQLMDARESIQHALRAITLRGSNRLR